MNLQAEQAILIVDDNPNVTDTCSRLLQLEGFTVYAALDPEGGLEVAAEKRPAVIILDLRMPILNGLQFLQRVRGTPMLQQTPVVIVTGDYFLDDRTTAQIEALGASVRFKPLHVDDLVALVRGLMAT